MPKHSSPSTDLRQDPLLKRLKKLLKARKTRGYWPAAIRWYHGVGSLLCQMCPKHEASRGALPRLINSLNCRDSASAKRLKQEFYKMRDLAHVFPNVKPLLRLKHIRWGHLRILSAIKEPAVRNQFMTLCENCGLSCEQLSYKVQLHQHGPELPRDKGRRPYQTRSLDAAATAMELNTHYRRMCDLLKTWLDDEGVLNPNRCNTPAQRATLRKTLSEIKRGTQEHLLVIDDSIKQVNKTTRKLSSRKKK